MPRRIPGCTQFPTHSFLRDLRAFEPVTDFLRLVLSSNIDEQPFCLPRTHCNCFHSTVRETFSVPFFEKSTVDHDSVAFGHFPLQRRAVHNTVIVRAALVLRIRRRFVVVQSCIFWLLMTHYEEPGKREHMRMITVGIIFQTMWSDVQKTTS